jgi:hypothetical protein
VCAASAMKRKMRRVCTRRISLLQHRCQRR